MVHGFYGKYVFVLTDGERLERERCVDVTYTFLYAHTHALHYTTDRKGESTSSLTFELRSIGLP